MSADDRLQEMIAAACLRAGSEAAFTADLRGFLLAHGVGAEDVAAITAAPPRLALYRRLVRNNLTGVTDKMLTRTRARMEAVAPGAFDASFASFLDEVGPRTHHLRDVPGEFLDWIEPRWRGRARDLERGERDLPPWIADLARHELAQFQVAAAVTPKEPPRVAEIAADRPLVFAESVRLMQYAFAVHELPPGDDDRSEPARRPTSLLVYRDGENVVQTLELSPFAAAITRRLLGGAPLLDAVRDAAADVGASPGVLDVSRFLADLGERGVLLGARA